MTTVLVVTLTILFILTAVYSFLHLPRTGMYIVLWGVRGVLLIMLLGAFLQPALRCDQLAERDATVGVVIDNSMSMQLFNTTVATQTVRAIAQQSRKPPAKTYFTTFGDSVRRVTDPTLCRFDEQQSLLPAAWNDPALSKASRMIIISDGNWSNPSIPRDAFSDKECFFITLTKTRSQPFLDLQPLVREIESTPDSSATVAVRVWGWSASPQRLEITLRRAGLIATTRTITTDSGYFSDTVQLSVRTDTPGRHRYVISVRGSDVLPGSAPSAVVLHTVVPSRFTVYRYAPIPSLDNRFLSLGLDWSAFWKPVTDPKQADLLVVQTWDAQAQSLMTVIKPTATVLFWGCQPCTTANIPLSNGEWYPRYTRRPDGPLPFDENTPLPLPAGIITCGSPTTGPVLRIFSLVRIAGTGSDTLTILSQTRIRQRTAITVHALETWRWDFWTRSFNALESEYPFTRYVLEEARQLVIRNTANTLLLYPREAPLHANQPVHIRIIIPTLAVHAAQAQIQLRFVPVGTEPAFDTIFEIMPGYDRYFDAVAPPMPQGRVVCSAILRSGGKNLASTIDTLDFLPDNSEMRVMGQNTALLREVARELDPRDSAQIAAVFTADQNAPQRTIHRIIQIQPSAELLVLILALLGFEWVARRRMRLD